VRVVHGNPSLGRVVVGKKRVVRRIVDRASDRGRRPEEDEEDHGRREAAEEGGRPPQARPDERDPHAREPIGVVPDQDLAEESDHTDERDHGEDPGGVESECISDLRDEHPERRPVELVDGVQSKEEAERE
jgi:hypothetical protein